MKTERLRSEEWARETFGSADLGDVRRTARLVKVAARAAERPSGKLSEVFEAASELDAAYDFVERDQTSSERLDTAAGRGTAKKCAGEEFVYVVEDGSSLAIVDGTGDKGLGCVGTTRAGAHGLKVVGVLAVGPDGCPIGPLTLRWWARPQSPRRTRKQRRASCARKAPKDKETHYWLEAIDVATKRLDEVGARGWFQLDREADAWPTLTKLSASGHRFTVRSAWDRVVQTAGHDKQYLRAQMAAAAVIGTFEMEVSAGRKRTARRAKMVMHAAKLTLSLRDKLTSKRQPLATHVVWVHEQGTTPAGEKPIDWMLLTNAPIDIEKDARLVVLGYSMRWRIEDFHRTWKRGGCNVELTQLRSRNAIIRWATILAMVAARIERLKHLARTEPERPASDELKPVEIEVLRALKRRQKKKTESDPRKDPSLAEAVRWRADLGGYTGKSSGGPPGSITIGRGLRRVLNGVEALLAVRAADE
jgi:hypothetical protein